MSDQSRGPGHSALFWAECDDQSTRTGGVTPNPTKTAGAPVDSEMPLQDREFEAMSMAARIRACPAQRWRVCRSLAQLSHRYASDTRNAPENCGVPRPMSICGVKNHCPFRGHLALTGSTLMCWRRCSRNAVRTVGRRKSRLDHRFSLGALQSELPPPWHVWCLNRSAPHNALISSHIFSSGGKVGLGHMPPALPPRHSAVPRSGSSSTWRSLIGVTLCARPVVTRFPEQNSTVATPVVADKESVGRKR